MRTDKPGNKVEPSLLDKWILAKLVKTIQKATTAMEECDFMNATESVRNFTWHIFCDHYLEASKYRLYGEGEPKLAAQQTLYYTIERMLKLLAPITPHITEEIYSTMYAKNQKDSIHTSIWPTFDSEFVDEDAEKAGDLVIAVIGETRALKNRLGIPLNKPVKKLVIYASEQKTLEALQLGKKDLQETLKIGEIEYSEGIGEVKIEGPDGMSITLTIE